MKKIFFLASLAMVMAISLIAAPSVTKANGKTENIGSRLSGRILLSVQNKGEAWYVNPGNQHRYFLGRPNDAFNLMRQLGLGISNKDFDAFNGVAPARLAGRILIKVEDSGKAYYVNPVDLKLYFLGTPFNAFQMMRDLSLGITDNDLNQISAEVNKYVSIVNYSFSPSSLTINKGTIVTWTNNDNVEHAITSLTNFNSNNVDPSKTYSHMFSIVGTYNYYDPLNPNMTGTVIVK
jgi:plastocyanin